MLQAMAFSPRCAGSLPVMLAILAVCPAVAAAPVRRVVMAWSQDDPTCIGAADLTSMVERTLARPVFHADAPPFAKVTGAVGRVGSSGFEARVALLDMDGRILAQRTLTTSGDCGRLDESVAVVVTLMIDGVEEAPTPLQIPAAPARIAAPQLAPPGPQRRPLGLTLGLGGGVSSSLLPGVVGSFGVRGEVDVAGFVPLALTLRVHAPSSVVDAAGEGGRFSAWTGELAACPAWARGRVRLGGCVGLGSGAIEGVYVNLIDGESHVRPLFFAALLPFAAVRLTGPLWARAEAGAWFSLLREPWGYLDARGVFNEVFRPALVIPTATLTLELHAGS
jgi:hypothetical protein